LVDGFAPPETLLATSFTEKKGAGGELLAGRTFKGLIAPTGKVKYLLNALPLWCYPLKRERNRARSKATDREIAATNWQRTISIIFGPADGSPRMIKVCT
jgi:hypothetical protein